MCWKRRTKVEDYPAEHRTRCEVASWGGTFTADIVRENDGLLAQLQQGDTSEQGKQVLADIGVKRLAFQGSRRKVFEALDAGQIEQGLQLQEQLMKPALNAFRASVAAFVELQQQRAQQFGAGLQQASMRNQQILGLTFLLAVVLGTLSAVWIARSINHTMQELSESVHQVIQRNAGLVDASTAATGQLRDQAQQLGQLAAGFRLS